MGHRIGRLAHFVRDVVSDAIANHVWDPRVCHFTSVTRVDLSPDLHFADVFVSVMGTDAEAKKTMQGLQSARGMIQTRLARQLDIRQCPILRFHLDIGIKTAIETFRQLQEAGGTNAEPTAAPSDEADDPALEEVDDETEGSAKD